jgi:hypothetical protein
VLLAATVVTAQEHGRPPFQDCDEHSGRVSSPELTGQVSRALIETHLGHATCQLLALLSEQRA